MKFGFDWPSGFRGEDYYVQIHVYSPGAVADSPQGLKFSININLLSNLPIPSTFYPLYSILSFFPIQMHWRPKLALP